MTCHARPTPSKALSTLYSARCPRRKKIILLLLLKSTTIVYRWGLLLCTSTEQHQSSCSWSVCGQLWGPQKGSYLWLLMNVSSRERIDVEKEEENLEPGRIVSGNPNFQLLQPPKPQGGLTVQACLLLEAHHVFWAWEWMRNLPDKPVSWHVILRLTLLFIQGEKKSIIVYWQQDTGE